MDEMKYEDIKETLAKIKRAQRLLVCVQSHIFNFKLKTN